MKSAALVLLALVSASAQQVKINEIQLVGTHNSYHSGISPNEMATYASSTRARPIRWNTATRLSKRNSTTASASSRSISTAMRRAASSPARWVPCLLRKPDSRRTRRSIRTAL
jgi:hypothetical protein